jgi:hypothetical protein
MKKVHFIIGGVQKGGTTALFEYLRGHPDLAASAIKETHFFDEEHDVDWSNPKYERYHSYFRESDLDKLWFEATPIYIFWPNSLERIRTYHAGIRLIFIFRDPIERAWSHWSMEYARGAERLNFATAIRAGRSRLNGLSNEPARRVFSYIERGFYGEQVERVLELFRPQQVLFLTSHTLLDNPTGVLRHITNFLGIAPFENVNVIRANSRLNVPYPSNLTSNDIVYLQRIFADEMTRFCALTDIDISTWLSRSDDRARG